MRIGRKSLVLVLLFLGLTFTAAGQLECVTGDCDREGDPSDPTDNGFYTDQTPHSMISDNENMNFDYLNDPEGYPQDNKRQWPKACGDDPNEYLIREHAATYGGESNPDLSGRADYYACADRPTDCVFDGEVYSQGQLVDIQGEGGQESGYVDSVDQEICVDIDPEIPGGEWVDPDNESVRNFLIGDGTPQNPEYYVRYGEPTRTDPGKVMWHNGSAGGTHNEAAHEAMISPFNPADFQTGYALEDDCDPRLRDDQYSGCDDTGIWEELIRGQFVYSPFKAGMYADDPNAFGEISVRMWVGDGTGEDGSASHGSNNGQDQENVPGHVDFTVNAGGETVELNDSEIDPLEDTWAIAENPHHAVGPTGGIWPNGSCYGTPVLEPYDMQVNKGERVVGNSFAKALDVVGDESKEGVWVDPDTTNKTTLTGGTSCDLNGTDWGIGYNTGSGKMVKDNNAEPEYEPTDLHVVTGDVTFDINSDPNGVGESENLQQYPKACGDDRNEYLIREHRDSIDKTEQEPNLRQDDIYVCADRISDCAFNGSVYGQGQVVDVQSEDREERGANSIDEEICVDADPTIPGGEWYDVDNESINQFLKGPEGTYTPDDPDTYEGLVRDNASYDGDGVKWFTDDYTHAREVELSPFNPLNYSDGYALEDDVGPGVNYSTDEGPVERYFTPHAVYSYFEDGHIEDDRLASLAATGTEEEILDGWLFEGISVQMKVGWANGTAYSHHGASNNQDEENVHPDADFNITKWGHEIPLNDSTINRREDTWAIANRTDAVIGPKGNVYMDGKCYGQHVMNQPDLQLKKDKKAVGNSFALSTQLNNDNSDRFKGVWVNPDSTLESATVGNLTCELNATDWGYGFDIDPESEVEFMYTKETEDVDDTPEDESGNPVATLYNWNTGVTYTLTNRTDSGPTTIHGETYSLWRVDGWQEGIDGPGEVVLKKGEHYPDDSELTGFDCGSYEPADDEIKICSKGENRTFAASDGSVDLRVIEGDGNDYGDIREIGYDHDDPHVVAGDIQFDVESDPTGFDQDNLPQYPDACGDDRNEYLIREHNASQEYNDEDNPSLQRDNIYVCADRVSDCAYNGSVYSEGEVIDIQANDPPGVDEEAGHNSVDEEVCVDVDKSVPGGEWMDVDNSSINQFIKGEEGTYTPDDPSTYSGHVRPNSTYDGEGVKWFTDDYEPAAEVELSPFNPLNYSDGYALEDDCGPGLNCSDEGENLYDFTPEADYSYFEESHIEDDRLDTTMATGDRDQILEGDIFNGISVRMWVGQADGTASYEHGATNNQDEENVPESVDFNITKWGHEIPLNDSTINRREDTWAIANRTDAVVGPTGQVYMNGSCYGTHVLSQPDLQLNKSQKVVGNSYAMSMQIPSDGSDYKKGVWVNPDSTIKSAEQGILTCELNSTDWGYGYDKAYEEGDEIPEEEWSFTGHSDGVNAVDVGPNGNVYSASIDGTVKKISADGNEIWSFEGHTDSVEDVAVDSNGHVYTTARGSDYTTRKLNSEGEQIWSFPEGSSAVAVDSNENVYIGPFEDDLVKISPEGNEIWRFTGHNDLINDIVTDSEDNIYSTGYDETVRKISSSGNEIWSFEGHTNTVFGLAVNSAGEVYSASWDETLRKISPTGDEIWKFSESSVQHNDVEVGPSGSVYSVTIIDSDPMYKISSDGEKIWSLNVNENDGMGVAVDSNSNAYTGSFDETVRKVSTSREKIETETPELSIIRGGGDEYGDVRENGYDRDDPHVVAGDIQFDNLSDPGNYNQDNLKQYPNACGDDRNEYLIREHRDSIDNTEQNPNLTQEDIYVCADRISDCAFNGEVYSEGEVVDIQSHAREERGANSVDEEVCVDVDESIPGGEWMDVDNSSLNQYLKGEEGTYTEDEVDTYDGHVRANETYDGEGVKWFTDDYSPAREVEISPFNPLNYSDGYALEDDVGPGVNYSTDEGPVERYFTPKAVYSYFEEGHIEDDRLNSTIETGDRDQILEGDLFEGVVVRMRVGFANGTTYTAHGQTNDQDEQNVPDTVDFTRSKWGYTIDLNDSTINPREDTWAIANRTDAVVGPTGQVYMNGSCYGRNVLNAAGYNVTKGEKVVGNSYAMSLDVDGDGSSRKRGVWVNPDSTNKSALSGIMSCDLNATDWGYGYNTGDGDELTVVRGDARENGYEEPGGHVVVGDVAFDSEHDPLGQPQDNLQQYPEACGDDRNEYLIREHRAPSVGSEHDASLERDNIYACADRITDCVYNGTVYSMGQTKDVSGTTEELGVNSGDAEVCVDTNKSIPGGEWHDPDNSSIQDIIVGSGTFEKPSTYDGKPTFERRGGGVRWFNTSYGEDLEYPINESLTSPWSDVDYSAGFAFEDDCDERLAYCEDSGLLETHKEGVAVYGPFEEGRLADDGLDSQGDRLIDGYHIRMWVNGSAEHGAKNGQQSENVYRDLPQLNDSTIDPNEDTWAISSEPYYAVGPTGAVYENGSCYGQTNPDTKAGTVVANSFVLAHDVDGDGVKEGDWVDPDNHEEAVLKGQDSCSLGEVEDWGLGFKNESRDELKIVRGKEEARSLGYETSPDWQKQLVTGPITFDNESISGENPGSMDQDDLPQYEQACGDDQNETLVREHYSLTKDLENNKSDEHIPTLERENIYVCADRPSDCAFNGSVYSEGQLADVSSDREAGDNSSDLEVCIDSDERIPGGEWHDLDNDTWNQYLKGEKGTYTPDDPSTYERLVETNETDEKNYRNYWLTDENPHANETEISPYNPLNYSDGYALEDDCDPDLAYCADIGEGFQHKPGQAVYNSFVEDEGEDDANILVGKAVRLYVGYANGTAWAEHGATNNQSEENAGELNFTHVKWGVKTNLNDSTIDRTEDTWAIANRSDSVVGPTGKLYDPGKCYGGIPDASQEEWKTKNKTVMANSLAYSMEANSDGNMEGVWVNPDSTNETLLKGGFSCELNTSDWGIGYDMGPDSNVIAVETSEANIRTPGYEPSDLHAVSGPIAFDIESDPGPKEQKDKPQYPSACGDDQGEFLIREHTTPDGNEYNESLQNRDNIYVCADRISDCAYNGEVYSEGQTVDISNASIPDEDPEKGDNINDPEICLDLDKSIPGGEWYDMDNNWTVKSRIEEVGYAPKRTWDNVVYFQNRYFGESPGTDWRNHTHKLNRTELDYFNGTGNYSGDYDYYAPKGYAREDDCGPLMRQASTGPCGDVGPGTQNTSWFNAGNNSYVPSNDDIDEGAPQDNYDDSLGFKGIHNKINDDSDQLEPGAPTEANWNLSDVFGFGYKIYDSRDSTPGPDKWALTRHLNYSVDNRGRAYAPGTETRAGCFYRPDVEPRTDIDDETVLKTEKVFGNSFANATDYDGDGKVEGVWKNPDDMEARYGNFSCDLTGPDKGYGIDTGPDDGEFKYKNDDNDTKVIIGDIAFATIEGKTGSFDQEPPVCGDDHKEYLIEELGSTSNSLPNQGRFGCGTDYDDCVSRTGGEFALYRNGDYVNTDEAVEEFGRVKQDKEVCQQTTGDKYGVWYDQDYSEEFCRANNLYGQVGVRWFNQSYIDKHPYSVVEGINDDMNPYLYQKISDYNISLQGNASEYENLADTSGYTPVPTGKDVNRSVDQYYENYDPSRQYLNYSATGGFCGGDEVRENIVVQDSSTELLRSNYSVVGVADSADDCVLEGANYEEISHEKRKLYDEGDNVTLDFGGTQRTASCYGGTWYSNWPISFIQDNVSVEEETSRDITFQVINIRDTETTYRVSLEAEDDIAPFTSFTRFNNTEFETSVPAESSRRYNLRVYGQSTDLGPENITVRAAAITGDINGTDSVTVDVVQEVDESGASGETSEVPGLGTLQLLMLALLAYITFYLRMGRGRQK